MLLSYLLIQTLLFCWKILTIDNLEVSNLVLKKDDHTDVLCCWILISLTLGESLRFSPL